MQIKHLQLLILTTISIFKFVINYKITTISAKFDSYKSNIIEKILICRYVTNCKVCGFILVNNKQSRFHFDRIDFTNHWMLYCKCDIQFRLIIEIFRMSLEKENSICYILILFEFVCEFSNLFAISLTCSQSL